MRNRLHNAGFHTFLGLAVLGLACQGETPGPTVTDSDTSAEEESDVIDLRARFPEPDENTIQIVSPDMEVGPFTDLEMCYYGSYDGPDVGVNSFVQFHPFDFHHHSFLRNTPDEDTYEDGAFVPCPPASGGMARSQIFQAVKLADPKGDGDWISVPEGYAFAFPRGQRWYADLHYINTSEKPLIVNTAFNLGVVPAEEVHTWISTYDFDICDFTLPPQEVTAVSFDCPLPAGANVLSVFAHMHEAGQNYQVELVRADGTAQTLLETAWGLDYRYSPPNETYQPGEMVAEEGDVLRTTCTWNNTTDQAIMCPEEMCTTQGVASGMNGMTFCERADP